MLGGVAVERLAVEAVEEGEQLVVLLLRDRVVLVVVAAGAADGQAEEDGADGVDAVDHVADVDLLVDRAALAGGDVAAVEAGGDLSARASRSGSRSPASCSMTNRSNGMLRLNALMTQSR